MSDKLVLLFNTQSGKIIISLTILLCSFVIERIVRKLLNSSFEKHSKLINIDPTQFTVLKHATSALIYVLAIGFVIYMIPTLKAISISLFAGAGILAVVVGFASQKAFSNIISGLFIAVSKPFRVGDIIKFGDKTGIVEDITLRHTVIKNFENKRFVVPNSIISEETIENFNIGEERTCRYIEIGISYDSSIDKAMAIMQEEVKKHPMHIDIRNKEDIKNKVPEVVVRLVDFKESSINLRAYAWAKDPKSAFIMGCDLNKSIKQRFDKEGIEIPFPYRTIVYKDKMKKPVRRYVKTKKTTRKKKR